ncbi:MAG: hypothetical protein JNM28_06975 [Armatimonadetes bacterium]|nr:hypothetical protein [Armatimonadota bacterium]MBS1711751.1 hypothetical protein [Armatimonadota bacterium]MBX3109695.1 hypothetical protein [Fimbriimonadaceae bacterium]
MTIAELREILPDLDVISFRNVDGTIIPAHFHLTEVGLVTKHFIDCGGVERTESVANFQLWVADDDEHRLTPTKFQKILGLSQKVLGESQNLSIEVEYQQETIGKFGLGFEEGVFVLIPKQTACLAPDRCGLTPLRLANSECCTPGSGCC